MQCLYVAGNMTKCPLMRGVRLQEVSIQARIQAGLHRFTEIGQIFQMTQNQGKYNFRECLPPDFHRIGAQTRLVNRSQVFFLDPCLPLVEARLYHQL